jgi:hypothetical protein
MGQIKATSASNGGLIIFLAKISNLKIKSCGDLRKDKKVLLPFHQLTI